MKQIVGILPGGVETDDEVNRAVALDDAFEPLAEEGVAGGRLGEGEFGGGGLEVVAEEGGVVAIAGGVDADAEASRRLRSGSVAVVAWEPPRRKEERERGRSREAPPATVGPRGSL